jgi:hypothetical protein
VTVPIGLADVRRVTCSPSDGSPPTTEVVMETFRELLDAGWGERHLDAVTGGCPGCGSGDLVIVEDAEHELKLFCRECDRCWGVEGDRLHHVDPVGCPGCGQEGRCFGRLRYDVPRWGGWNQDSAL